MKYFISLLLLLVVSSCASPYAKFHEPLTISGEYIQKLNTSNSVNRKLGKISFDRNKVEVCLWCLTDYRWRANFGDYWENLFDHDYPILLRNVLDHSAIFNSAAQNSLSLRTQLISFSDQSNGGNRRKQLTILYTLLDGNSAIQSWRIDSSGHANNSGGLESEAEASHEAITQNITMFVLKLIADTSQADSERVSNDIAELNKKMETENASAGNIIALGFTELLKAGKTVGSVIGSTVSFIGQNSGVIAAELNKTSGKMADLDAASRLTTVAEERAKAARLADFNARVNAQESNSNSALKLSKTAPQTTNTTQPQAASKIDTPRTNDHVPVVACVVTLNIPSNTEEKWRREAEAANARNRATGLGACPEGHSGPSEGVSK